MATNPKPLRLLLNGLLLSLLFLQIIASPEIQAEALVKWKNSLSFPTSLSSWSLTNLVNLCNWKNIICDSTREVSQINLSGAKLNGTLAQFNFTPFLNLTHFDLSHNNLSGSIPLEIGQLMKLQYVSFYDNFFSGIIPYQLTKLQKITDKCDVYSFGVVTLEVMMGRHPRELLSFLSSSKSMTSASILDDTEFLLNDVLDPRLPSPEGRIAQEIIFIMTIALQCVCDIPESRPTMRFVAQELSART